MTDAFTKYPDLLEKDFVLAYDFNKSYTKQDPDAPFAELDVAAALIRFEGNLATCAFNLGRSRRSLLGFIERNELLKTLLEDIESEFLDAVETLHKGAALTGDLNAQRFFLTTKGKNRGYVTRNEATGKDGAPFTVNITGKDAEL